MLLGDGTDSRVTAEATIGVAVATTVEGNLLSVVVGAVVVGAVPPDLTILATELTVDADARASNAVFVAAEAKGVSRSGSLARGAAVADEAISGDLVANIRPIESSGR